MKPLALGIMSGTSGDGVSLALARFTGQTFRLLGHKTYPYSNTLTNKIRHPSQLTLKNLSALNFELGALFARRALAFLKLLGVSPARVAVVGSHGQTIFHGPHTRPPSTLQIGESSLIAELTGITTVSDFRPRDMTAGGQGAPLIPFFDQTFFGRGPARSLLNLGGIANLTLVGKKTKSLGFDTGPGNCLMDWAAQRASGGKKPFDRGGEMAAQGRVDAATARELLRHPYFLAPPPKSTGRELFNEAFLPKKLKAARPKDLLATLTYFTALSIYDAHRRFVLPTTNLKEVLASGGGVFNRTLMRHLREFFRPITVRPMDEVGLPSQAKEPLAFAFFAWNALQGRVNHWPQATGARGPRVLGKITPGKNFRGLR